MSTPPTDAPMRRALALLTPYRGRLVAAGVLGIAATAVALSEPLVIGMLIDRVLNDRPAVTMLLALIGLFLVEAVIGAIQIYVLGRAGLSVVLDARHTIVHRLLRAPLAAHLDRQRGDVFARVVTDTSLLRNSLTQGLSTVTISALMVLGCLVLMAIIDPWLTLATLACVLGAGVVSLLLATRLRVATRQLQDRVGDFGGALSRALGAIRTVKVSRAEPREEEAIVHHARRARRAGVREVRVLAAIAPTVSLGVQGSFAAVFTVGAFRLASGALDTAMFAAFLLYLFYLISPLVNLFMAVAQLQQGMASMQRIGSIVDLPAEPDTVDPAPTTDPGPVTTDPAPVLRFERVDFGYLPQVPVLHELTFDVPARGLTAIVGPSGSGKSTILALATRFWLPDQGRILLDGRDIRQVPLAELRSRIGYVEQDAPILDGTIRDNLTYANPDATAEAVATAVDMAHLRTWVDSLEAGLDTPVGEAGAKLSGGERQRIAVARILLASPEVLLLDEATSQLDASAESALRASVHAIARTRAVVAIAHRMSTVMDADHILVLEGGRLRAQGDHHTLMDSDELYRSLVETQLQQPTTDELVTSRRG